MTIRDEDVRKLEALAALCLEPRERQRLREQLDDILTYVRQLESVDVEGVPPTTHVLATRAALRPDAVQPSAARELMLRNAAEARSGFYRVPSFVGEAEEP